MKTIFYGKIVYPEYSEIDALNSQISYTDIDQL